MSMSTEAKAQPNSEFGSSLLKAVQVLREYKKKGESYYYLNNSTLNDILCGCHIEDNEDDLRLLRELLNCAKELKQYWDEEDKRYYGPLFWIQKANKDLALKLVPYFVQRGYRIDIRRILSDKILKEFDKLNVNAKKRKLSKVEAVSVEPSGKRRELNPEDVALDKEIQRENVSSLACYVAEVLNHEQNDEIPKGEVSLKVLRGDDIPKFYAFSGAGLTKEEHEKHIRNIIWPRVCEKREEWTKNGKTAPRMVLLIQDESFRHVRDVNSAQDLFK